MADTDMQSSESSPHWQKDVAPSLIHHIYFTVTLNKRRATYNSYAHLNMTHSVNIIPSINMSDATATETRFATCGIVMTGRRGRQEGRHG